MKNFILIVSASITCAVGCTTIRVVDADKESKTVTIQGSNWDLEEKIKSEAENYCASPVTLQNREEHVLRAPTSTDFNFYRSVAYRNSVSQTTSRKLLTYKCNR